MISQPFLHEPAAAEKFELLTQTLQIGHTRTYKLMRTRQEVGRSLAIFSNIC